MGRKEGGGATIKTLSIRQPWASLIIHGHKPVENRSWRVAHRGPLLIHASKQFSLGEEDFLLSAILECLPDDLVEAIGSIPWSDLPRGAIIGQVNLVDIVRDIDSPWAQENMLYWLLENPQAFAEPIPWRGRQGLFEIDAAELEAAKERVTR